MPKTLQDQLLLHLGQGYKRTFSSCLEGETCPIFPTLLAKSFSSFLYLPIFSSLISLTKMIPTAHYFCISSTRLWVLVMKNKKNQDQILLCLIPQYQPWPWPEYYNQETVILEQNYLSTTKWNSFTPPNEIRIWEQFIRANPRGFGPTRILPTFWI